jgi:hypothetical protein
LTPLLGTSNVQLVPVLPPAHGTDWPLVSQWSNVYTVVPTDVVAGVESVTVSAGSQTIER